MGSRRCRCAYGPRNGAAATTTTTITLTGPITLSADLPVIDNAAPVANLVLEGAGYPIDACPLCGDINECDCCQGCRDELGTCAAHYAAGETTDGYYWVDPDGSGGVVLPNPNAPTGLALARDEIRGLLERNRDALDEDSLDRLHRNPLRILDSKNPDMREVVAGAPVTKFISLICAPIV